MIDAEAIQLVSTTNKKIAAMKDARPSEILALKEQFADAFLALLLRAKEGIPDEHKIKIFDKLLEAEVEHLRESIEAAMKDGTYFPEEDHDHFVYQEVVKGTLGKNIFTATNEFEKLLSDRFMRDRRS